jgi:hypothetical protein
MHDRSPRTILVVLWTLVTALGLAASAVAVVLPTDFGADDGVPFVPLRPAASGLQTEVHNLQTNEWFATLYDALADPDTVSGHTLEVVAPSITEGQVLVSKSVTIQGQSGTEVVQMGVDTGTSGDSRGWFVVDAGVHVTVQNLVFDGSGHLVYQGFRVKGTAAFDHCTFRSIQYEPSGPTYQGQGVSALGNVTVTGCTFEQIGRVGVLLWGTGVTAGLVEDCLYTGKGAGDYLEYGFELNAGAVATVQRNQVFACLGTTPDGWDSSGMMMSTFSGSGTTATFTSNVLIGNLRGIQVGAELSEPPDSSTATAAFNRIVDNTEIGLGSASLGTVLTENNWWGCNAGPGAVDCDTAPGAQDYSPWLTLTLTAVPSTLMTGEISDLTAATTLNSDGVDTSGLGAILDGTEIAFSGTLGTVAPATAGTAGGVAMATYTAGGVVGIGSATDELDYQTVTVPIEIVIPVELMRFTVE